ncbi:protein faf-like chloroplastic [Phtheirospermum japonicum]|uniref:Protein faf-like chloroplastic n=1 Tax=Phtheirospermum japonicum TaxID=374723 RepID=A0A830CRT3_9LAMI|nr:protein faf-like chloroplastic [Phtheirospermum japonicum]
MPVRNQIPTSPAMKQGIVTILGSDCEKNYKSSAASIRRTLSADMSSKKWLHQNGFFAPLKNIATSPSSSSSSSSSSGGEEEFYQTPGDQDDVWRSIQANIEKMVSWDSILTQKSDNCLFPPPYVHPLVKRSVSGLSEKSLEICTESLGSETGSDCFSSANRSTECLNEGDEVYKEIKGEEFNKSYSDPFADLRVVKYKSSPARPLPPPLPSVSAGGHVQSRRENGRLILEAVSVSPKNYFHAQRGEGRLVLTLVHGGKTAAESEKVEEVFDGMEDVPAVEMVDDGGGDGGYEEEEFVVGKNLSLPSGMIGVHKSGLVMRRFVAVGNMNATWPNKVEEEIPVPQSLPPPPMARLIPAAAASFNAYEYFWRNKTTGGFVNPPVINKNPINNSNNNNNNNKPREDQNLVITKGNKGERFVPYSRGCKEPRRSLLFWDSYCIATS